jgi:hypothetical protein
MAHLSIDLPAYTEDGALIVLSSSTSPNVVKPYCGETLEELANLHRNEGTSIAAALAELGRKGLLAPMIGELENRARRLM